MKSKHIKGIALSDIHLGNRSIDTQATVDAIIDVLEGYEKASIHLDLIIISGDVFDRELTMSMKEVSSAMKLAEFLTEYCVRNDIYLRVVRGTMIHDQLQSQFMVRRMRTLAAYMDTWGPRFGYFDTVAVEYIERFDMNVLYIPDNFGTGPIDALAATRLEMGKAGLEQVDIGITHGFFRFHKPVASDAEAHDQNAYDKLVKHFIFNGHDHTHKSWHDKIIVPSSFNRNRHGEEEPKGYIYFDISDKTKNWKFVPNPKAEIFTTIRADGMSTTSLIEDIKAREYPDGSHIRIIAERNDPIMTVREDLSNMFPSFFWKFENAKEVKDDRVPAPPSRKIFSGVDITPDNVAALTMQYIKDKFPDRLHHSKGAIDFLVNELGAKPYGE